ncbi:hypothetical protein DNTS_032662, partial [Danionella cerebrum]
HTHTPHTPQDADGREFKPQQNAVLYFIDGCLGQSLRTITEEGAMDLPPEISVLLLSLSAPFLLYAINQLPFLQDPQVILALVVAALTTVFLLANRGMKSAAAPDPLFYVFAVFSFTSVLSLTNALQQDGFIKGFMDVYVGKSGTAGLLAARLGPHRSRTLDEGGATCRRADCVLVLPQVEPHLSSAHGILLSYWEGLVHFLLLLLIIHRMSEGKSFRNLALLWSGSMVAAQTVLISGMIVGKYNKNIPPVIWRSSLSLIGSVWTAVKLLSRPRELSIIPADKLEVLQRRSLLSRPVDLLLTLCLLGNIAFTAFRGFVVLECSLDACFSYIYQYEPYMKDSVGFPKLTMLVFLFYAVPLLWACVLGLLTPGCSWMLDWTLVLAGAVAQAQWTHLGASLHSRTPFTYRIPKDEWSQVMVLNLLSLAVPVLLALRCHIRPAFFLQSQPHTPTTNGRKQR